MSASNFTFIQIIDSVLFFSLFAYLPLIVLFYFHKNLHPIGGRTPGYIILLDFDMILVGLNEILIDLCPLFYPCYIRDFIASIPYLLGFTIYNYRLIQLLWQYKMSENIMEQQKNKNLIEWKENWYSKNRWLVESKTINRFFLIQNTVYFITILCAILLDMPTSLKYGECDLKSTPQFVFFLFIQINEGLSILVACIAGWKLKSHQGDAFSLKQEVATNCIICGSCFLIWLVIVNVFRALPTGSIFVFIVLHTTFITGTVYPYVLSTKEKKIV